MECDDVAILTIGSRLPHNGEETTTTDEGGPRGKELALLGASIGEFFQFKSLHLTLLDVGDPIGVSPTQLDVIQELKLLTDSSCEWLASNRSLPFPV